MATNPLAVVKAIGAAQAARTAADGSGTGASPLVAAYSQLISGSRQGQLMGALPRTAEEFIAQFGPLTPMPPMALDRPQDDGRPEPRRWQYPVGWNLPVGQPGTEGYKLASFAALRRMADAYSVVRSMINIRKEELAGVEWDVGPTPAAQAIAKGNKAAMADQRDRANKIVNWFKYPDSNYHGFQSWFSALLEELFVIDATSIYVAPTRLDGKGPFGSSLAELQLLSGDTIRPLLDVRGSIPRPPYPAYQQFLWGVPRSEMMSVIRGDDMEEMKKDLREQGIDLDDDPEEEYRRDQLLYLPYARRTWTPYGFSAIEQALTPIALGLNRQSFLLDYFTEGTVPGVYVVAGDSYTTPALQRQLQDTLNAIAGDTAWKHRVIVLPPGSSAEPQKDLAWSKDVDQTIIEQVAMILHIQPQEIGMVPGGRTSGLGGAGVAEFAAESVARGRTEPHRNWFKATLFDWIIQEKFGQGDLEWKWVGFEEEEDGATRAQREAQESQSGVTTIDQIRIDRGLDPYNFPLSQTPFLMGVGPAGVLPLDPAVAKELADSVAPPPPPGGIGPDGKPLPPEVGPDGKPLPPGKGKSPFGGKPGKGPKAAKPAKNGPSGGKTPKPGEGSAKASKGAKGLAQKVHAYLSRTYPEADLDWVTDPAGSWEFREAVPLADINMARRPGGRDPKKVESMAARYRTDNQPDPVVLVDAGSEAGLAIADGYHRTKGAQKAGLETLPAYVGTGFGAAGPWDREMHDHSHKKAALAELAVLRRYLTKGRSIDAFKAAAIDPETMDELRSGLQAKMAIDDVLGLARVEIEKYSPDQPRDDQGRWTDGGGSSAEGSGTSKWTALALGHLDSKSRYTDAQGNYTPERQALHRQIIEKLLANGRTSDHPVVTMTGGGPAAGKSVAVGTQLQGAGPVIDVDGVKGMLPEYTEMVAAGEKGASTMVHEESSDIARMAMTEGLGKGSSLVYDSTGDNSIEKLSSKIDSFRAAGAQEVVAHYVVVDPDKAVERANARGAQTGRYVPESYIRETHASVARVLPAALEKGLFDRVSIYDTNSPGARLIATYDRERGTNILDNPAWERFIASGQVGKAAAPDLLKYSPDQPRDEQGEWTDGGGSARTINPDDLKAGKAITAEEARAVKLPVDYEEQDNAVYRPIRIGKEVVGYIKPSYAPVMNGSYQTGSRRSGVEIYGADGKRIGWSANDAGAKYQLAGHASKTISLGEPLGTGLVPFDLAGQKAPAKCGRCGNPLLGDPNVPISEAAVGLCGDCQVDDASTAKAAGWLAAIDAELARRGVDLSKLDQA